MVFIFGDYVFYILPVGVCFFHSLFPTGGDFRRRYEGKEFFSKRDGMIILE